MAYGTVNADTLVTSTSGGILGAGNASIMKNRIINGAMVIDQRNAGASVTPTNAQYTLDRWDSQLTQTGKYSVQQNAGGVTPPAGFTNYLGVTSLSSYTLTGSDIFDIFQNIEGYNIADLNWGSVNAKTVTLSFWAYSSLTGTFGGSISNNTVDRSYPFSYTISTANTWTQISVTIPGDTTGTWGTTNGVGIRVWFGLGVVAAYSATAGAWTAGDKRSSTGAVSVVGTSGATFYITGVQLEVGSSATGFEYRQYGQELALCQRYYEKSYNADVALGASTLNGIVANAGVQGAVTGSEVDGGTSFKVTKRTTPTMAYWDAVGTSGKCTRVQVGVATTNNSSIADNNIGANGFFVYSASGASAGAVWFHFSASAEL